MTTVSKVISTSVAAGVLLAGMTTVTQGRESRGLLHINGSVVCAPCSLEEIRPRQPEQEQLYQFMRGTEQLVMRVRAVNDFPTWRTGGWPREIPVRAQDAVFQQLMAEENWLKEVEITGALSSTRALDIFTVTIRR